MIFKPFQSHNHLKRHFASFCDIEPILYESMSAMRSSSQIRCQATAFSLCPLAVSLHSRFLRCRLHPFAIGWFQCGRLNMVIKFRKLDELIGMLHDVTWCCVILT
jgi:hypothetical protein